MIAGCGACILRHVQVSLLSRISRLDRVELNVLESEQWLVLPETSGNHAFGLVPHAVLLILQGRARILKEIKSTQKSGMHDRKRIRIFGYSPLICYMILVKVT